MMKPMYNKASFLEEYKERKAEYKAKKLIEEVTADPKEVDKNVTVSIIGGLIKSCWTLIDEINADIIQLNITGSEDLVPVLQEMITDNYMHIGQLEKLLEGPEPAAENIDDGREAAEEIESAEEEAEEQEVELPEDEEEGEEDYPDDVIIK